MLQSVKLALSRASRAVMHTAWDVVIGGCFKDHHFRAVQLLCADHSLKHRWCLAVEFLHSISRVDEEGMAGHGF
jgi:hypothetical protein